MEEIAKNFTIQAGAVGLMIIFLSYAVFLLYKNLRKLQADFTGFLIKNNLEHHKIIKDITEVLRQIL